jgi:putative Mn2+ efflux pump MntP
VALGFTALGMRLGRTMARARRVGRAAEVLGGVVLLGIGIKILADHGALPF